MTEVYRGAWVVAYREVLVFVRDRTRIIASLAFPLVFLGIFGGGFSDVIGMLSGGVGVIQFMYPGIVVQGGLISALAAGLSVAQDRETGFLREILVAPLSRTGIVLGKAIGAAAVALLQTSLLLVVAPFVGVSVGPDVVLQLVPVVVVLSLGLSGIGIIIASFMSSPQGVQMLIQVLVFPMIFLAGIFFPVDRVPFWMEVLSKANPVTYGVDAIRQIFLGSNSAAGLGVTVFGHTMALAEELVVVSAFAIIALAAAEWSFGRQE